MNARPLVSVVMPCYNAAETLPWALASLLAQTFEDWECIVVDDGSTDHPEDVVAAVARPEGFRRVHLLRLQVNQGRAAARQAGLDLAEGSLLAKLDADDWYYPEKLERQVEAMQALPGVGLVSTGIAIENAQRRLVGVRARGSAGELQAHQPLDRPVTSPVAHAPSMVRMEIAKRHGYDRRLRRSEDADFMLRVLLDCPFCVLPDVLYAYAEYRSASRAELLDAYRQRMRMFWGYRRRYPLGAALRVAESAGKWAAYRLAFAAGRGETLVRRRSAAPSEADVQAYQAAQARVSEAYAGVFGGGRG